MAQFNKAIINMGKESSSIKKVQKSPKRPAKDRRQRQQKLTILDSDSQIQSSQLQILEQPKPLPRTSKKSKPTQICLQSAASVYVQDIDLKFYTEMIGQLRVLSVCLVDKYGRFLYYDRRARQHFEGSLNNLRNRSLFDLMIPQSRNKLASLFDRPLRDVVFKYIVYSKNTKRKYIKKDTSKAEENPLEDIYFRYLKSLSSRIRPIRLNYTGVNFSGEWTQPPTNQEFECFLVETRPSMRSDSLEESILQDETILKFQQQAQKKRQTRDAHKGEGVETEVELRADNQRQLMVDNYLRKVDEQDEVAMYLVDDEYILQ